MAERRNAEFCRTIEGDDKFEEFVIITLNADCSDCDLSDDEDSDPSFVPGSCNEAGIDGDSSSDDEVFNNGDDLNIVKGNINQVSRKTYWRKSTDFFPLPPAPEHQELPHNPVNLLPEDYFPKYITDDFYELLSHHTNQRYLTVTGKILNTSVQEIKNVIGVTIIMSFFKYPRIRMYWARKTRVPSIAYVVSRERYLIIQRNLKLLDDNEVEPAVKCSNKFWKVEPLQSMVQNGCRLNPRPKNVCIDEQIIPFWGHSSARQFVKNKPNPCGIKLFVVAASDGLPLNFFLYQGKGDLENVDPEITGLHLGGKVVIKLTETLPPGLTIYMDRYFASVSLLDILHVRAGCQGIGTIQKNRIPQNSKLKDDM